MKILKVGMLVRLTGKWEGNHEPPKASVGIIDAGPGEFLGSGGKKYAWAVKIDHPKEDYRVMANSDELEPILYDGNKTTDWSKCLWKPEGTHA